MRKPIRFPRRLGYAAGVLAAAVAGLAAVVLVRTALHTAGPDPVPHLAGVGLDEGAAARRLAGAVAIETVSRKREPADPPPDDPQTVKFLKLHDYLKTAFPKARDALTWETVGVRSLLLTWKGSDPALGPLVLLAHMDVVPAVPEGGGGDGPDAWAARAFAGEVDDEFVWGRGTLDDKVGVVGTLEAVESLLKAGFAPRRTVLLAYGCDEEVSGTNGAARVAAELKRRGVRPECLVDEGSFVLDGILPGLAAPLAPIGVAEKGYADVVLTVAGEGGHSSLPGPHTAIGRLARAVARLEDRPMPARLDGLPGRTFAALGPEMPFLPRIPFANLWLFGPVLKSQFAKSPPLNALVRTTAAVTLTGGGTKDNVLPSSAWALVNYRLMPGDRSDAVLAHVLAAVADPGVSVAFADPARYGRVTEASAVSPSNSPAYDRLKRSIRQTFPGVVVVPYLVTAATDARHYQGLTPNIYRFLPVRLSAADLDRIHGRDERIPRRGYADAVQFYARLIRNFDGPGEGTRGE